ncbi:MAG: TIGR02281 family clan AA aspartic protease [Aestuariivita sp.]|nr:TIGR02281 family clan AA aspartic protease [Aestuariivita sp.]MCY4203866.1 TIGR02281 family clan AA aspartic protease [Aestuariivita sp.]
MDHVGQLIFLIMLGIAVVYWFFVTHHQSINRTAQQIAAWSLIFVGVIAAVALWQDVKEEVLPRQAISYQHGTVEVPRFPDGHFYMTLLVNGTDIPFVVDTGATKVVLSKKDATRLGIDSHSLVFRNRAMTANGEVMTAPVSLDRIEIGDIVDHDIDAAVNSGELEQSLLGMNYLQLWKRIELLQDKMILIR